MTASYTTLSMGKPAATVIIIGACTAVQPHSSLVQSTGMSIFLGLQVATELIVGFGKSFATQELMVRQQKLWSTTLDGFVSLPINLPGFGKIAVSAALCMLSMCIVPSASVMI